jgi:hypothetical protein
MIHYRRNSNQSQLCISMHSIGCLDLFCLGASVELRAVLIRIMSQYRLRFLPKKNQIDRAWKQWREINLSNRDMEDERVYCLIMEKIRLNFGLAILTFERKSGNIYKEL